MNRRFPRANLRAFEVLFSIENAIRELIVDELTVIAGAQWFKQRLPGDVLQKYRDGVQFERKAKWIQLVPHHPIYYVDFPDLRKVILRTDNWKEAFKPLFQSEEVIQGTLLEIELIRNKIAHNRKVSDRDLEIAEAARTKLAISIGEDRFLTLAKRCTHLPSIRESAARLLQAVDQTYNACRRLEDCSSYSESCSLLDQWWFDAVYMGTPIEEIVTFFRLIGQYQSLPRVRGEGYKLEQWVKQSGVEDQYQRAKRALAGLT